MKPTRNNTLIFMAISFSPLEWESLQGEVVGIPRAYPGFFPSRTPESRIADLLDAHRTPEAFPFDASGTLRYHGRIASKISAPDLKDEGLRLRDPALGGLARRVSARSATGRGR